VSEFSNSQIVFFFTLLSSIVSSWQLKISLSYMMNMKYWIHIASWKREWNKWNLSSMTWQQVGYIQKIILEDNCIITFQTLYAVILWLLSPHSCCHIAIPFPYHFCFSNCVSNDSHIEGK
jgi:hypothetical protein